MSKLKEKLTRKVAGIILKYVKAEKGRLTRISEDARINRKEFNIRGLSMMKLHRLLRITHALYLELSFDEFAMMMNEINDTIIEYGENYEYTLLDE